MNLWLSSSLLVAGLFVSISAEAPECQPVTPLSLDNRDMIYGRLNLIMAYTESREYQVIVQALESCWMNISSTDTTDKVDIRQESKINGTCLSVPMRMTVEGDSLSFSFGNNITNVFRVLPSCEGCVVFSITAIATNFGDFLSALNFDRTDTRENFTTRVLYLMAREDTVKDSDLEDFKKLASCLGFSGEPDFVHDTKKGFCEDKMTPA